MDLAAARWFDEIDHNNDGLISRDEFASAVGAAASNQRGRESYLRDSARGCQQQVRSSKLSAAMSECSKGDQMWSEDSAKRKAGLMAAAAERKAFYEQQKQATRFAHSTPIAASKQEAALSPEYTEQRKQRNQCVKDHTFHCSPGQDRLNELALEKGWKGTYRERQTPAKQPPSRISSILSSPTLQANQEVTSPTDDPTAIMCRKCSGTGVYSSGLRCHRCEECGGSGIYPAQSVPKVVGVQVLDGVVFLRTHASDENEAKHSPCDGNTLSVLS